MTINRRFLTALCVFLTPLVLVLALLISVREAPTDASSHREAPAISKDAFADNTDTYVWIPADATDRIVLAASWIPFEGPEGGPNYWEWDDNVVYQIHIDNNGDAVADISYMLTSSTTIESDQTFLYNVGEITTLDDADWIRKQRVSIVENMGGTMSTLVDNQLTTPNNIGGKSIPDYGALEAEAMQTVMDDGDEVNIYAGQTDDPFWVDLQVFDLLTLRGQASPIGYADGPNNPVDSVAGFNNHSLIIELPIDRLTQGDEPVLGVWATASRDDVQVSRLGMPLVNELVLPMALKDTFNSISPDVDLTVYAALQESVENPEIGTLLCALYGVPLPGDSDADCNTEYMAGTPRTGRGDIFDIFLTGMVLANDFTITISDGSTTTLPAGTNVNQPANVVPAEMIRLNTALAGAGLCSQTPSRLGVLGGDACGFPNGRRPMDDIVEIELLAVAGAAYEVLDDTDADFSFNPAFIAALDDGLNTNDVPFRSEFPYFAMAQSGRDHVHTNECQIGYMSPLECMATALSFGSIDLAQNSAPWIQLMAALASLSLVGGFEWLRRRRQR
jgi:hypothetical protein